MKFLNYLKYILKGETMKIEFNTAQLSRPQQNSLVEVLNVLQAKNKNELVVTPVEFPIKLKVKLDDSEMLLGWDAVKHSYIGLENPESEPEPAPDPTPEPTPEPRPGFLICCLDMDGKVISSGLEPDIDPIELARLKYELMSTHLDMPVEKKIIFNKEYARLWSEHK